MILAQSVAVSVSSQFGKWAEREAEQWFLLNKKAKLLFRNYRCMGGEIDLIFEEKLTHLFHEIEFEIVFVEVRARSQKAWIESIESISNKKRHCLVKAISHFLKHYHGKAQSVRVDLMAWNGKFWEHTQNLWISG